LDFGKWLPGMLPIMENMYVAVCTCGRRLFRRWTYPIVTNLENKFLKNCLDIYWSDLVHPHTHIRGKHLIHYFSINKSELTIS
jgi:hypothetical protein